MAKKVFSNKTNSKKNSHIEQKGKKHFSFGDNVEAWKPAIDRTGKPPKKNNSNNKKNK